MEQQVSDSVRPADPRVERGSAPTASLLATARTLPIHNKPEWTAGRWPIPADVYTSPENYQLEQQKIFRRLPVPLAPSVMLKEPNSVVCRDGYGVPVLVTRDGEGRAHTFLNVCQHRGSRLTTDCTPQATRLVICPYHAWSYDLSGNLVGVPHQRLFNELDKREFGLVPLPCYEAGGMIWTILDKDAQPDFSHVPDALVDEFKALGLADMHLFAHRAHEVAANWKLVLDTFLEGYHVTRLHRDTLGSMFKDTTSRCDRIGEHLRQTSGRLNFVPAMIDENKHIMSALRRVITVVYTIIPNAALICSPDYVNLMLMHPQAHNRTIVHNFMLTNEAPRSEKAQRHWDKSLAITDGSAFLEDFMAASLSQEGLETGGLKELTTGGYEFPIHLFHENIARYLQT